MIRVVGTDVGAAGILVAAGSIVGLAVPVCAGASFGVGALAGVVLASLGASAWTLISAAALDLRQVAESQ